MTQRKARYMEQTSSTAREFFKNPLLSALGVLALAATLWMGTALSNCGNAGAGDDSIRIGLAEVKTELRLVKERQGENWEATNQKLDRIMDIIMQIQKDMR